MSASSANELILIDPWQAQPAVAGWGCVIINGQELPLTELMVRRACEQADAAQVFPFDASPEAANGS